VRPGASGSGRVVHIRRSHPQLGRTPLPGPCAALALLAWRPGTLAQDPGGWRRCWTRSRPTRGTRCASRRRYPPTRRRTVVVRRGVARSQAVGVWRAAPRPEPVAELPPLVSTTERSPEPASGPGPSVNPRPPEQLVVAVAGRVARPGLVRVAAGARVADVLDAAGGALPGTDLAGLNLARRVSDGEQVAVGVPPAPDAGPQAAPPGPAKGASPGPGGVLDLNTASVEQLDGLPGVGPVTAQRIVEWRTRNGRFAAVDQLREVEGIGERRFAQLRGLVRI
jgi:competence protein ComEA